MCTPASVDSIVSSNGQEDHVSMGANAATKLLRVTTNLKTLLAIELFNACQALHYRKPLKTSPFLEQFVEAYRSEVPFIENDVIMSKYIEISVNFINHFQVDSELLFV